MRNLLPTMLLMLAGMLALPACKTTEANYRAAYEAAAERRANKAADAEADFMLTPQQSVMLTMYLSTVKTSDRDTITPTSAPRFAVAVNRFKQVFNAKALCNRLRAQGLAHAYVAQTPEEEFYVMAQGFADESAAKAYFEQLKTKADTGKKDDNRIPFGRGYPALIRAAWR